MVTWKAAACTLQLDCERDNEIPQSQLISPGASVQSQHVLGVLELAVAPLHSHLVHVLQLMQKKHLVLPITLLL